MMISRKNNNIYNNLICICLDKNKKNKYFLEKIRDSHRWNNNKKTVSRET